MEQVDNTEIKKSETPEAFYSAIKKCLATSEDLSCESAYKEARNIIVRFRKVYSKLPDLPDHKEDAVVGLQEIMDWCVRAIDIVDHMTDDMDESIIEGFISILNKLKGLPASGFPNFDKAILKKAQDRAQKIVDKYRAGKKPPKGLNIYVFSRGRSKYSGIISIISSLKDVADRKAGRPDKLSHIYVNSSIPTNPLSKQIDEAHTEMSFYRAVEKIYRLMDSNYTTALAKLEDSIFIVFKEWNKLNDTDTGNMLDKYDELKGIELEGRIKKLEHAYSIDSIVDTALFGSNCDLAFGGETRESLVDGVIETLHCVEKKIKGKSKIKQSRIKEKTESNMLAIQIKTSKDNWEAIENEYGISKRGFGRKINFVSNQFVRKIIFRDVEHAFVLASQGLSKAALILAGGVIEELLRLYLEHKDIKPQTNTFYAYIKACEDNGLLKRGVSRLSDSVRDFRNLVHLVNEETKRHTVSKATAKGAVASIFTIANDFQ
ncbi:MAG: hypothetical protein OEV87_09415 [Phycisphaerae bacterium]|nr:hypothetical protein [Phycisphaerae bacterium]